MTHSTQRKSLLTYLKWLDQNVPSNKRHKWHRNSDARHVGKVSMEALQAAGFMNHVHLKYKQNIMSDKDLKQQNFLYVRQSINAAEFSLCQTKHQSSRTFLTPDKATKQQNISCVRQSIKTAEHSLHQIKHKNSRTFLTLDKASKQQNIPYTRQSIKTAEHSLHQIKHQNSRTFLVPDKASKQQNIPYTR